VWVWRKLCICSNSWEDLGDAFLDTTGSELRRPLGIAMVGALFLSQVVTLLTTPVIYLWLDRIFARRKAPAAARLEVKEIAGEPG